MPRDDVDIPLAVLIVEDSESDAQLILRLLKKAGYELVSEQVETAEQMRAALEKQNWDIVISDYSLPQFDGRAALELLQETGQDIPFIIVSGAIGEESAVAMMKAGAHDYLMKGKLARLAPAVARELKQAQHRRENKQAEQALRESEEKYRVLVNNSPDNIERFDRNYRLLLVNHPVRDGIEKLMDMKAGQFIGKTYRELGFSEELCNYWEQCLQTVFVTGKPLSTEYAHETPNGVRYYDWQLVPELGREGQIFTVLAQSRDITGRKQMDEALRLSELDLKEAQAVAHIGNWKWNLKNGEVTWSDEMYHIFGIDKNSYTGRLGDVITKMIHPDDLYLVLPSNAQAFLEKETIEYRIILADKSIRTISAKSGDAVLDDEGNPVFLTGVAQDITERVQAEDRLRQLARAVEHSPASIVITDINGRIEYVNPKFTAMTGFTLEEMRGKPSPNMFGLSDMQSEIHSERWQDDPFGSGREWYGEFHNKKKNGDLYWESATISPIMDANGVITHFVSVNEDITARKEDKEKIARLNIGLEELAMTDYLTSLYNRRYFMQRGAEEFKRARRNKQPLSLLMLDIDKFKSVNDGYGHEAGDMALQQVAAVLKSSLRDIDILGRIGGEEFAVLLPNTLLPDAVLLAERVRQTIADAPLEIPGASLTVTISIGVSIAANEMSGIDDMLRNADAAMYQAKRNGRNRVVRHEDVSGVHQEPPVLAGE